MESQPKILIVEDEVFLAELMVMQLEIAGYSSISTATTGEQAILNAKEIPPHIVLMDIRLAGEMDGIEAALVIKSESNIPIVFITGYADTTTRERAEKVKPLAFLLKPFDISELKTILDTHFAF